MTVDAILCSFCDVEVKSAKGWGPHAAGASHKLAARAYHRGMADERAAFKRRLALAVRPLIHDADATPVGP